MGPRHQRLAASVGQLLSSPVISGCDHALEPPNGVVRRLLDAPLKRHFTLAVYISELVCNNVHGPSDTLVKKIV